MTLKSDANFKEKMALGLVNLLTPDLRNLVNFNASSGKSENFHFHIYMGCVVKNDTWFQKCHKSFGEFSRKKLKVMLDKSSVYVLAAGMYFLDKGSPLISTFRTFYSLSVVVQFPHVIFKAGVGFLYKFVTIL